MRTELFRFVVISLKQANYLILQQTASRPRPTDQLGINTVFTTWITPLL